ncbi:MAG TPA: CHAT domain-containing protein, partial [Candidatus Tectomicrobia bacterium]
MRIPPWHYPSASPGQRCPATWSAARWWLLPLAVLCGLGTLGALWSVLPTWGTGTTLEAHMPAQAMADGQHAFQRGDFASAVTSWQQAAHLYAESKQPHARSVALTRLAHAYEALGHADRAEDSLRTALPLAEQVGAQAQVALILGHLGELALAAGNVTEAERLVREALTRAQELADAGLTATLLQAQGNTFMGQQHWSNALTAYRTSARVAQQATRWDIAARALAHAALAAERAGQIQTATTLLRDALATLRQGLPSHDTAADLLVIGRAYHRLAQTAPDLLLQAAAVFQEAATMAQTLQDPRALSSAWGYLGRLYEEAQRYDEALDLTRRAAFTAQQVDAPESLYQWQWQTGRLLRALGNPQAALEAYTRAVETVQSLHATLVRGQWGLQTTFREAVGPLYIERTDLLLHQAAALEAQPQPHGAPQYAEYLRQARATIELLKTAELRDYFGDACVDAVRPRVTALERVSPDTAIVYPILLDNRTELLLGLPGGLTRAEVPVPGWQVEQRAQFLRSALEARDPERYLQHAHRLYQWLIQPLEAHLAAWPIQTLVFVPDGALRLIPPAVLYDGQQYLIEKYAVAITPSLSLTEPHPLPQEAAQVLVAGLAEAADGFPPLPYVREEVRAVQKLYGGTVLLDQAFSPGRLDTLLQQGRFAIVHIAAHGHFAAEAHASFLLTAQGKLSLAQLAQSIG